jgi:hypothetical protein
VTPCGAASIQYNLGVPSRAAQLLAPASATQLRMTSSQASAHLLTGQMPNLAVLSMTSDTKIGLAWGQIKLRVKVAWQANFRSRLVVGSQWSCQLMDVPECEHTT